MTYKYVIRNVAKKQTVTFMPKPIAIMVLEYVHQSIWKDGKPLFAGDGYAGLSKMALHYIGGLIKHAPALLAFTTPQFLQAACSWFEAPVNLAYSQETALLLSEFRLVAIRRLSAWVPLSGSTANPISLCCDAVCWYRRH